MNTFKEYISEQSFVKSLAEGFIGPAFIPGAAPMANSVLSMLHPSHPSAMNELVQAWYLREYPDDPVGGRITKRLTFRDLALGMDLTGDPRQLIGTDDQTVIERIMSRLAVLLGCDYSVVYDRWLNYRSFVPGVFLDPWNEWYGLLGRAGLMNLRPRGAFGVPAPRMGMPMGMPHGAPVGHHHAGGAPHGSPAGGMPQGGGHGGMPHGHPAGGMPHGGHGGGHGGRP